MRHIALALTILAGMVACTIPPRQQIRIVGSSTVYPFVAAAAEQFGRNTDFPTPIVESTGTGGGLKLFCAGVGPTYPDMANASRAIKSKEKKLCADAGITDIREIPLGFDGIVLANPKRATRYHLTKKQIFLALAKQVPQAGRMVENPYRRWNDIDPALPDRVIEVYGPPATSGTRDAMVELIMHESCVADPAFIQAYSDEDLRKEQCAQLREDGRFIDAGENDNIIVQKLDNNPEALGIFGYSFLEQNAQKMQGSIIDGAEPTFAAIANGSYGVSRSLYVYVKGEHIGVIPGVAEFADALQDPAAVGPEGYMTLKGLIPLPVTTP